MLTLRLQRVQLELASHRAWLRGFAVSRSLSYRRDALTEFEQGSLTYRRYASTDFEPVSQLAGNRPSGDSSRRQAGNVKAAVRKSRKAFDDSRIQRSNPVAETIVELLTAVREYDITRAIEAYKTLPEKKPLEAFQVYSLIQCLHQCIRVELRKPGNQTPQRSQRSQASQQALDEMVEFAMHLAKDIRNRRLQSPPPAHVHLMAAFKESGNRSEGLEFWHWLEKQDDVHVDVNCYAVAIDMLAKENTALEDLEDLYSRALARFPGTFSAYHLSPNAILPDREAPLGIPDLPTQLLQSITHARLMRGDTRDAYLGLDSVFRIFPNTVQERFARLFQTERPASEYYTIFAMFCRAGIPIAGVTFKALLASIRESVAYGNARSHAMAIRSILSALYLQLCSGGLITGNSISELTIVTTHALRHPGVAGLTTDARRELVNAVLSFIRTTMEIFARYRILPPISIFNSLITNVGGYGRSKQVIGIVSADMERLGYAPTQVTRRSMLAAAGLMKDGTLVEKYWQELVDARKATKTPVDGTDFRVLVTAVKRTGQEALARSALEQHKAELRPGYLTEIPEWLTEESRDRQPSASEIADAGFLVEGIRNAQKDLAVINEKTKDRPAVQDFAHEDLCMALFHNSDLNISEADMRDIYNEYTVEQVSQPLWTEDSNVTDPITSSTGLTLAELRYENWKSINYLLWLSERHDNAYAARVDDAISKGVRPPRRNMGIEKEDVQEIGIENFGMSNPVVKAPKTSSQEEVAKARALIARLRSTNPE